MGASTSMPDDSDASARFRMLPNFERFDQRNDLFCRSHWDPKVRTSKTENFFAFFGRIPSNKELKHIKTEGFESKDFAIRNAAWHVVDMFAEMKENEDRREGFLDPFSVTRSPPREGPPEDLGDPIQAAEHMKRASRLFGADLVGVTAYDERWHYTGRYSRIQDKSKDNLVVPESCTHCIVIATAMDRETMDTAPSPLSEAAVGLGYTQDAICLITIAQYLMNLGYEAVASMNDTALAIPYAIKAGLGEYGRHGLLITPKYGPRVRLGKVYTNLPLAHDKPVRFGVEEFCGICQKCATACPAQAISKGSPDIEDIKNISSIKGIAKWTTDGEKCFKYWAKMSTACAVCIRVCPYNRDGTFLDEVWMRLASFPVLRHVMLWLDERSGRGAKGNACAVLDGPSWQSQARPWQRGGASFYTLASVVGLVATSFAARSAYTRLGAK